MINSYVYSSSFKYNYSSECLHSGVDYFAINRDVFIDMDISTQDELFMNTTLEIHFKEIFIIVDVMFCGFSVAPMMAAA